MSSPKTIPYNYSLHSVPGAFLLGIAPHGYMLVRLMTATSGQMSNAMPRTNLETWKSTLTSQLWNHLVRARGAHLNSLEVFPLFAAAMVAGNVAKLPARDLNNAALSFLAARTLYIGLYMSIKSNALSYARTGVYAWSISIPIMCLWKAGRAVGGQDVV